MDGAAMDFTGLPYGKGAIVSNKSRHQLLAFAGALHIRLLEAPFTMPYRFLCIHAGEFWSSRSVITSTNRSWAAGVRETYGMSRLTVRKRKDPASGETRSERTERGLTTKMESYVTNGCSLQSGFTPMFGRAEIGLIAFARQQCFRALQIGGLGCFRSPSTAPYPRLTPTGIAIYADQAMKIIAP